MIIKFAEEALEAIVPPCYTGRFTAALGVIGKNVVARANKDTGMSWAQIAGKIIYLEVIEQDEKGEVVALIRLPKERP